MEELDGYVSCILSVTRTNHCSRLTLNYCKIVIGTCNIPGDTPDHAVISASCSCQLLMSCGSFL